VRVIKRDVAGLSLSGNSVRVPAAEIIRLNVRVGRRDRTGSPVIATTQSKPVVGRQGGIIKDQVSRSARLSGNPKFGGHGIDLAARSLKDQGPTCKVQGRRTSRAELIGTWVTEGEFPGTCFDQLTVRCDHRP